MNKLKNDYGDGTLSKGYPHRRHGKRKKRKVNLVKKRPRIDKRKQRKRGKNTTETEKSVNMARIKLGMPPTKKMPKYKEYQKKERKRIEKKLKENRKYEQRF